MAQVVPADYPVLFWLLKVLQPEDRILDAGGHLGTKYLAFRKFLPLEVYSWTIQDLPNIVRAAVHAQNDERLPVELNWVNAPDGFSADILLASGLLQYIDISITEYVSRLSSPPRHILLNKVATRAGPEVVTLERIGPARVPYRVRNRAEFEAELTALGYEICDSWDLPDLANVIPTHPWLGASLSRGYMLTHAASH